MSEAEPREGLPPCMRVALMDDRIVGYTEARSDCGGKHPISGLYAVSAGFSTGPRIPHPSHPEVLAWTGRQIFTIRTDDPAKAEAAYEKGKSWVWTGELE